MAYNPEEDIKVSDLPEKTTNVVSDDKLLVIDSEDANILKQVDASKVGGGGSGTGDMLKSVYDTNDNGIVDNAEALGGVPASDYAKSADVQPTLESGVNIKTINGNSILGPGNIEIQGGSGTVDTEMSDSSTNAVQNKVIKEYVDSQSGGDGTTKTFIVGGASTIAKGQEILDWYRSGKNPIVMYEDRTYYLTSCDPTGTTNGKMILSTVIGYENSLFNTDTYKKITIEFDNSDTVTTVGFDIGPRTNGYLDTRTNYSTPYTPLYDGSPATKKYVDDKVMKVFTLTGSYSDSNLIRNYDGLELTTADVEVYQQAREYYLNGGLAVLKKGGRFLYPDMYYSSADSVTFTMLSSDYMNGFTVSISVFFRDNKYWIRAVKVGAYGSQYFHTSLIKIDELTDNEYVIQTSGYKNFSQFRIGFELEIFDGNSFDRRYSGWAMGEGSLGYGMYSVITTSSREYRLQSSNSYKAKIFDFTDTTNRGTLGCNMYYMGAGADLKLQFTKNRTNNNKTIRMSYYIQTDVSI